MILRVLFSIWHDLLLNLRKAEQGECVCFRRFSNSFMGPLGGCGTLDRIEAFFARKSRTVRRPQVVQRDRRVASSFQSGVDSSIRYTLLHVLRV